MTNLKLTCNVCNKDLIVVTDVEELSKHVSILDFWAITCKDCIPNATVFRITSEEEKEFNKGIEEGRINAFTQK